VKLSERDDAISRLRQQSTDAVSQLEKTHMTELLAVKDLRDELQQQINESRSAVDTMKVSRPTRHRIRHFGDVLPSQSVGV